ncbi:MAG: DUF541 domain-containing protein [Xanthomonadales bacterium]|nr:DUF541 domain-containing protein [Xanthomonadales bacterium]NIX11624.1 DUF541 domain-containing protein [Xanthomonadales bacterium]
MKDRIITVSGDAATSVPPDLVNVRFGVEVQGKTAAEALTTNSEFMAQVVEAVLKTGLDRSELSTSQFNIYPVYEHHREDRGGMARQTLVGYRVQNMLSVETGKLDLVANIIDHAVDAGVNRIDQVSFSLSPEVRERLQDEMIEAAVQDAREKAERALAPLGYVVTGVRQMNVSGSAPPMPMYADARRMEMASAAPTQVFASEQDVRTSVNVTFLIGEQ